jgi:ribosome-associated protein
MQDRDRELAYLTARAADEKKARDIVILKVDKITQVADYFVICTGNSTTQTQAIADSIEEKLDQSGLRKQHWEGYQEAKWILIDIGSVVAHIFTPDERRFYDLERLWDDAERIDYTETVEA